MPPNSGIFVAWPPMSRSFVVAAIVIALASQVGAQSTSTYLGMALNLAATTPLGGVGFGQRRRHHRRPAPGMPLDEYVAAGCTYYGLGADWGVLQPSLGTIDLRRLTDPLSTIVSGYPQITSFGLTITMLNGARRSLPVELSSRAWDDPDVIATFEGLIDRIAMEPLLNQHVRYVLLGNEIFGGLPTPSDRDAFAVFFAAIVAHIHARLPSVQVGTIIEAAIALVGGPAEFDRMLALSDLAAFTYYPVVGMMTPTPITGPWQVEDEATMRAELSALMQRVGGKPVIINEIGVSASPINGSSERIQASRVTAVFDVLNATRPVVLAWHAQHDYDPALAAQFPKPVRAYVSHLGLRRWRDDQPRLAWDAFRTGVQRWSQ